MTYNPNQKRDSRGRFAPDSHKPSELPTEDDLGEEAKEYRRQQIIQLAHRTEVIRMWKTVGIEIPGITFPDTKDIIKGLIPHGVDEDEIRTIQNIRDAWRQLFDNLDAGVGFKPELMNDYNKAIGRYLFFMPGKYRSYQTGIEGSDWKPAEKISYEQDVKPELESDLSIDDPEERALNLFSGMCRGQWFHDGNKRTALMCANHILIDHGVGFLGVTPEQRLEFGDVLVHYYESNNRAEFIAWLQQNAMTYPQIDSEQELD